MTTSPSVFWTTRDWAETIAALPAGGPLPCRTVLVPSERVAHTLRRELIRAGHTSVLAGTRFIPVSAAAGAVLQAAGVEFTPGEEALRATRLLALFRGALPLQHFSTRLLQDKPGWDEAFARTITDLEEAGLSPGALEARLSRALPNRPLPTRSRGNASRNRSPRCGCRRFWMCCGDAPILRHRGSSYAADSHRIFTESDRLAVARL